MASSAHGRRLSGQSWRSIGQKKENKYHATRHQGFHSKGEYDRYQYLKLLEASGDIQNLKCQVRFPLVVNAVSVCTFVADFVYDISSLNAKVCEDFKGFYMPISRLKHKLFKALYPEFTFVISKAKNDAIPKR